MATLYEENIRRMLNEKREILKKLREGKEEEAKIAELEEEIRALERLYENYASSMGAFRRVKGSRMTH
jgi:CRISPR-associated protein Cas8b1/Cst1 subtype I-B